jgi:arylformamidase
VRIHDVSQPVGPATVVWPGDRGYGAEWTWQRARGDSVNVVALTLSVHTGTHADGPAHVEDGPPIGEVALEPYVGPAMVIDALGAAELDEATIEGVDLAVAQRVLFRTRGGVDAAGFPERFPALTPALARRLASGGVRLVGTDQPSVDPVDSETLDVHRILGAAGVAILENLVLAAVAPGRYTLIALPLRLAEADSSPVRAVLVERPAAGDETEW